MSLLERALDLAERGRGTTHPNPVVGAVIERDGEIVGEGWHERAGGPHAEVVALEQSGERARGATMIVTLEPCAHHGRTPPCADAIVAAGVARVVVGARDPDPRTDGRGIARMREAGVEVEVLDDPRARRQNEAWRTWASLGRPFVTLKIAATLDGRVAIPGSRWITGKESRRLVHELRAASDAVAVGMGTVRADRPALTARGVVTARQPRRLAFGRGPLPDGLDLELVDAPLGDSLRGLAAEDVQSLLLEGGPTIAASFLREDLVDKVLLFVAPTVAGEGPAILAGPVGPIRMHDVRTSRHGDDVVITAYVHEP